MNFDLLISNLGNPAFLFFLLGILAVKFKSDLEIPANSSKFISIYLLFSIGFKGGQHLSHEHFSFEIVWSMIFGLLLSLLIPFYSFFILKKKLNVYDSAAIAAAYGSVSAVTFVTAVSYLESQKLYWDGHMVAIMAIMESPAIISGLILATLYNGFNKGNSLLDSKSTSLLSVVRHSLTNGSVFLIIGSLVIGFLVNAKQAEGIKPFTNDIFKGFLAIFLLDMGISSGRKLKDFVTNGWFPIAFACIIPLVNGALAAMLSSLVTDEIGNRFLFSILAASASYIAVPAAIKIAIPQANPGIYLPMALVVTFPINITIGMPFYLYIIENVKL
ncbi:MAG: sodium-dependent bicarbonate transport family permease [Bacteroidetes bacterium]|nr:sodium-dependent bicarbonate transport family permease [Bacteroidota bacterium]